MLEVPGSIPGTPHFLTLIKITYFALLLLFSSLFSSSACFWFDKVLEVLLEVWGHREVFMGGEPPGLVCNKYIEGT